MDKKKQRVIAVDFDGTLAEYEKGDYEKYGVEHLGAPIPEMVKTVKHALAAGDDVVIFTARGTTMNSPRRFTRRHPVLPVDCGVVQEESRHSAADHL